MTRYRIYAASIDEETGLTLGTKPRAYRRTLAEALVASADVALHGPEGAAIVTPRGRVIYSADEYAAAARWHHAAPPAMRRVQYAVFPTREDARAAGWPEAEYGVWQVTPSAARCEPGWIALDAPESFAAADESIKTYPPEVGNEFFQSQDLAIAAQKRERKERAA